MALSKGVYNKDNCGNIKVENKAHYSPKQQIKQHGAIKNYRYVGDVSVVEDLVQPKVLVGKLETWHANGTGLDV